MKNKLNPGSFSINDNKLRIKNLTGETSVLFEDISSISFVKNSVPNIKYIYYGISIFIIGIILDNLSRIFHDIDTITFFIGLILILLPFFNDNFRIKFDDVIVETRGGMLLTFSVQEGEGSNQVDLIEKEKRLMTNKL